MSLSTIFQFYWWRKPEKTTLYHIMLYWVHLAWVGFELTTLLVIGTDCIGNCKSNYHMITTTTVPVIYVCVCLSKFFRLHILDLDKLTKMAYLTNLKWNNSITCKLKKKVKVTNKRIVQLQNTVKPWICLKSLGIDIFFDVSSAWIHSSRAIPSIKSKWLCALMYISLWIWRFKYYLKNWQSFT